MIDLGGLVWTYALGLEFWQHPARRGYQFPHLSSSAIRDYCVDRYRLGGARLGRCPSQPARNDPEPLEG